MTWPPAGHDRQRELFDDDAEPCEPPKSDAPETETCGRHKCTYRLDRFEGCPYCRAERDAEAQRRHRQTRDPTREPY